MGEARCGAMQPLLIHWYDSCTGLALETLAGQRI
jgi:hypothetical protein